MDGYRELHGLLLLAREIYRQETCMPVFADPRFPSEFVQVVSGHRAVPDVAELQELRPAPQQVFDVVILKQHCEMKLSQRFSPEGYRLDLDLDVIPE